MKQASKHDKLAYKLAQKHLIKVDIYGIINTIIAEIAKKDGLDVAELEEFEIEPYEIVVRDAIRKYVSSID